MTNTPIPALDDTDALARIAAAHCYRDLSTLDDAHDYFAANMNNFDPITNRHELRDSLDDDIADMLHNANLDLIFPFADDLSDDDYLRYSNALDDDFINALTLILARRFNI